MIVWQVPLDRYPETYNGQPLCYAALASQKGYCALYLMGVYQVPAQAAALKAAFKAEGKKADMGKSCIRFRAPEDLPLATIGKLVAGTSVDAFVARYEASLEAEVADELAEAGSGRVSVTAEAERAATPRSSPRYSRSSSSPWRMAPTSARPPSSLRGRARSGGPCCGRTATRASSRTGSCT